MTKRKNPDIDGKRVKAIDRPRAWVGKWDEMGDGFKNRTGRPIDWSGYKSGELTVIRPATKEEINTLDFRACGKKCTGRVFIVECSCGHVMAMSSSLARRYKSCGCAAKRGLIARTVNPLDDPVSVACRDAYSKFCSQAKRWRKLDCELTFEQYRELTSGNCSYCGAPPSGIRLVRRKRRSQETNKPYVCNGIDRLDSDLGYVAGNCVTCCKNCNLAKNAMTVEEFREWVDRISTFTWTVPVESKPQWDWHCCTTG